MEHYEKEEKRAKESELKKQDEFAIVDRHAIKITKELAKTTIRIVPAAEHPRLRGAVALVTTPAFAAPKVA